MTIPAVAAILLYALVAKFLGWQKIMPEWGYRANLMGSYCQAKCSLELTTWKEEHLEPEIETGGRKRRMLLASTFWLEGSSPLQYSLDYYPIVGNFRQLRMSWRAARIELSGIAMIDLERWQMIHEGEVYELTEENLTRLTHGIFPMDGEIWKGGSVLNTLRQMRDGPAFQGTRDAWTGYGMLTHTLETKRVGVYPMPFLILYIFCFGIFLVLTKVRWRRLHRQNPEIAG